MQGLKFILVSRDMSIRTFKNRILGREVTTRRSANAARRVLASFGVAAIAAIAPLTAVSAPASAAPILAPAAVTATGDDGLVLSSTPGAQIKGSASGFTLTVTDANLSNVSFDSYQISGLPDGWTLKAGGSTLKPVSPSPMIYEVPRSQTTLTAVAPANFVGTLQGVTIARVSDANNLVTGFDGGSFDYSGTAKPQLDSSVTAYTYKDPTTHAASYCNAVGQYAPCDGSYTIWPTANLNGPDLPHLNNRWADLRSVKNALPDSGQTASALVCVNPTFGDYESDPAKANTYQVSDADAVANGKFLIVNGSQSMPVPNDLIYTTLTGLAPNTTYTFSGYVANLSYDTRDTKPVQSAFYLKSSPNDAGELVGSSQPMPKQAGCENSQTSWTKMTSSFTTTAGGEAIIGVRNFGEGGHGNDLGIDQLSLTPMATVSTQLTVEPGSVSWAKVDAEGKPLDGSEWSLALEGAGSLTVIDNGSNDADPGIGAILVNDLSAGSYTLTEVKAPVGHNLGDQAHTLVIDAEHQHVSFGDIKNTRTPGSLSWSKTDAEDTATLLAGSEWTLVGPDGTSATIVDNGLNDEDDVTGKLKVSDLAWDEYTLTETKAPEGYLLAAKPVTVTVDAQHTSINLDSVKNTKAVPGMHVKKTSDPASGSRVNPGQEITYTVTVENTGNVDLTPAKLNDDLSDVLDNASYVENSATAKIGDADATTPTVEGTKLTWADRLNVGQSATITYKVKVNDNVTAKDKLVNVVTGEADVPPGITPPTPNCVPDTAKENEDCTTNHTPNDPPVVTPPTEPSVPTTPGEPGQPTTNTPGEPPLASTGAAVAGIASLAGLLALAGALAMVAAKRRRQHG